MNQKLKAHISLLINAPKQRVWEALTNPEMIRQYFFGSEVSSAWTVGSSITFTGVWEGKPYLDKGIILQNNAPDLLQYSYLSSWSNLEDLPQNYHTITYQLTEEKGITLLSISQEGLESNEQKEHTEQNWKNVMTGMKTLIE